MATIKEEIMSIAEANGYEGDAPQTIAEAVNALGTVMGGGGVSSSSALASLALYGVSGTGEDVANSVTWDAVEGYGKFYPRFRVDTDECGVNNADLGIGYTMSPSGKMLFTLAKKFQSGSVQWMTDKMSASFTGGAIGVGGWLYIDNNQMQEPLWFMVSGMNIQADTAEEAIANGKAVLAAAPYFSVGVISKTLINAINSYSS